ncbi:permease [Candidatus Omnitrophota bacterium]
MKNLASKQPASGKRTGDLKMLIPTIIMGLMAGIMLLIGYHKGQHITGIKEAISMTAQILPLLIFALIVAGMVRVLVSYEIISKWIGEESGIRGILIGTVAGAFTPGGPYVSMPIAAGLLRSGAGMGTMVAYITGWSLWAVCRLPMEVGMLGWRFTFIRLISVLVLPPIAGILAQFFNRLMR